MHELDIMSQHLPLGQSSPFGGSGSDEMHAYGVKRLCFLLLKPYRCEREDIMDLLANNVVNHPKWVPGLQGKLFRQRYWLT